MTESRIRLVPDRTGGWQLVDDTESRRVTGSINLSTVLRAMGRGVFRDESGFPTRRIADGYSVTLDAFGHVMRIRGVDEDMLIWHLSGPAAAFDEFMDFSEADIPSELQQVESGEITLEQGQSLFSARLAGRLDHSVKGVVFRREAGARSWKYSVKPDRHGDIIEPGAFESASTWSTSRVSVGYNIPSATFTFENKTKETIMSEEEESGLVLSDHFNEQVKTRLKGGLMMSAASSAGDSIIDRVIKYAEDEYPILAAALINKYGRETTKYIVFEIANLLLATEWADKIPKKELLVKITAAGAQMAVATCGIEAIAELKENFFKSALGVKSDLWKPIMDIVKGFEKQADAIESGGTLLDFETLTRFADLVSDEAEEAEADVKAEAKVEA